MLLQLFSSNFAYLTVITEYFVYVKNDVCLCSMFVYDIIFVYFTYKIKIKKWKKTYFV